MLFALCSYMLCFIEILVVEPRKRESLCSCHPMTLHRLTPLPSPFLNWMINRMLLIPITHIRPSTESDHASTPVWANIKPQLLYEEVRS